ncbi:MAG: hypothetical protein J6P19_04090 [Acetobacter sp.]|nr:hypothetical protein [Acetobacter sp.]
MDDECMHVVEDYANVDLDELKESVKNDELFETLEACVLVSGKIVENFEKIRGSFVPREEVLDEYDSPVLDHNGDRVEDSPERVIMNECDESFYSLAEQKTIDDPDITLNEAGTKLSDLEHIKSITDRLLDRYCCMQEE